jgi:dihydrofolate reductase/thymidylate synthase
MSQTINIILAVDKNGGLGLKNKLPWYISDELKIFKQKTLDSIVIVGRKTLEDLPFLKDRQIFCITRNTNNIHSKNEVIFCFNNIETAIEQSIKLNKKVFIIGGYQIYNYVFEKLKNNFNFKVHISFIKDSYDCDTYFDLNNLKDFYISKKEEFELFTHYEMDYQKYGEQQYLNLLKDIIKNGERRTGRNGDIISDFCKHLKFDLRNGYPLLTTKKMFLKGIIEELLFFIRGDTNSKILEEKGINIWKGNTDRKFLDTNGFSYRKDGEMGPMYGFQWRSFNKLYQDGTNTVDHKDFYGIDQLKNVINEIKTNPTSRRILLSTYNPCQVEQGVLYPCHSIIIQFYVQDGFLDMFCYNRSNDNFHGTPFNIASTSLLLMIISQITNLIPRFVNISQGDSHIYGEHIDAVKEQILRIPYVFPKLILPEFETLEEVEKMTFNDFKLENYLYYPTIKMPMIP